MVGFESLRKERPSKGDSEKTRLKDPKVSGKGHVGLESFHPRAY